MIEANMINIHNSGPVSERPRKPGTFQPGNPGKPHGARNKATMAALALLEGEREALTRKAIELALGGDTVALKLCLERLLPKGRAVRIDLPMRTLADLDQASETIRKALAAGEVSLDEVGTLASLVEARRRLIETTELERRLAALEESREP
jgi:hypothetical protein